MVQILTKPSPATTTEPWTLRQFASDCEKYGLSVTYQINIQFITTSFLDVVKKLESRNIHTIKTLNDELLTHSVGSIGHVVYFKDTDVIAGTIIPVDCAQNGIYTVGRYAFQLRHHNAKLYAHIIDISGPHHH
jgi:hypothetical protein